MIFKSKALATRLVTEKQLDDVEEQVIRLMDDAVAHARAAPSPTAADLTTDVYVSY